MLGSRLCLLCAAKWEKVMNYVSELASVITIVIAAVALYFTIRDFKKQLQLHFFADYTKRYQEIILNLPEKIHDQSFSIDTLQPDEREKTIRYMRAYFDLCSEEYFLWKNNNIEVKAWNEWIFGMRNAFSKPAFKDAWSIVSLNSVYHADFTAFVNSLLNNE